MTPRPDPLVYPHGRHCILVWVVVAFFLNLVSVPEKLQVRDVAPGRVTEAWQQMLVLPQVQFGYVPQLVGVTAGP